MARKGKPRKTRVDFRRNRLRPGRQKRWEVPDEPDDLSQDAPSSEAVSGKGDLSRKRTVVDREQAEALAEGTVIAVRGQFVDVLSGGQLWQSSVRRILRTVRIDDRAPVVVGDRVTFAKTEQAGRVNEAVIVQVQPRRTILERADARRTHVIAANVDQVMIVGSIREPYIKPHLIDRYIVAAHAGRLPAIVVVNKVDLIEGDAELEEELGDFLKVYRRLGYLALATSSITGQGLDELRTVMAGKATLLAGQSGVGKSSLLNAIYPGLELPTAEVSVATEKGRHTTTTARWFPLGDNTAVVDTPGIRALDVAMVPLNELEMHFVEFIDRLANCRYHNCVHIHEEGCAIKAAVERGEIDPDRYESYVQLFTERSEGKR